MMNPISLSSEVEPVSLGVTVSQDLGVQPDEPKRKVIGRYLPLDSSRQAIRQELFKRAMAGVSDRFSNPRAERRALARTIAKDLWRRGERLLAPAS